MEDGFSLRDATVGIVGLGLMGGSLAMGLKGRCARLIGFDSDPATLELARANKIVDQVEGEIRGQGVGVKVDLLVLATPVPMIIRLLQQLPSLISYPCIVIDIGSTKREIVDAMFALPDNFDPIGAHPICGKEKLGLENADRNLFHNAPFVITPLERSTPDARSASRQIASALGAHIVELTAAEHDRILASTSHLPFLLSSALALSTSTEYAPFIGSGFRSTARLAGTPGSMMMGVLRSNRDHIVDAIQTYRQALDGIETALQNESYADLESLLQRSRVSYRSITEN